MVDDVIGTDCDYLKAMLLEDVVSFLLDSVKVTWTL